jgi:hypothetical protein
MICPIKIDGITMSAYNRNEICLTATGSRKSSLTWYFGFFKINGNHQQANNIVKTTPPSIAKPPFLKLKKSGH